MNDRFRKQRLLSLLKKHDFNEHLPEIRAMPPKRVVNPLIAFLCAADEMVKWRSVLAIGAVVSDLAEKDRESSRVIMRRLIWLLNDESGGIGWGVPEAMGEIMACSPELAEEYGFMLVSYIRPDGNYIEHPMLQRGVLWGFGRLAHAWSESVVDTAYLLPPYLKSEDAVKRGMAAYAAGALPLAPTESLLRKLIHDSATLRIFLNGNLSECTVGQLARKALQMARDPFYRVS
jgi:hypothetical protein